MTTPRQVLLFSGHMVDASGRAKPRFPAAKVPAAAARIGALVAELQAGAADLALTQGAAGGDLLFSEACVAHGVPLRWLQPLPELAFITQSVLASTDGEAWRTRYDAVRARLATPPLALPPGEGDVFERCNVWLLDTALAQGAPVQFVCLWDGGGGDGPGGTRHMVDEVQRRSGRVWRVDPADL